MNALHSSKSNEHYTPSEYVDAARETMGGIDLDPASCELANRTVRASQIFTIESDGFYQSWGPSSRTFLNPPGGKNAGKSNAVRWWFKLAQEWSEGAVSSAVFVGFSLEILQTTQSFARIKSLSLPLPLDFPCCYPDRRIEFRTEKDGEIVVGDSPTHANVIVFLPPKVGSRAAAAVFRSNFGRFGKIVVPILVAS